MKEYIERAKLMDHIELNAREHEDDYDAWQILGDVEDFPAADVVERKRGEWINEGVYVTTAYGSLDVYRCSACDREITIDGFDNFCPNCGADMRGEKHEAD